MKKVVLFGAGASCGSGKVKPYSPPLGADLYKELRCYFPRTWGKMSINLNKQFESNFEDGMYELASSLNPPIQVSELMKNMAEYFVEFSPSDDSNLYVKFVKQLKSNIDTIIFSSLNYDLLFEIALVKNQLCPTYFDDVDGKVYFLKVHGSCNFLPSNLEVTDLSIVGYGPIFNCEIHEASVEEIICFCNSDTVLSPSMCLYTKLKKAQFAYDKIVKIQEVWKQKVLTAEQVLIIGTKFNTQDSHIWDTLSSTRGTVGYVGNRDAFCSWINSHRSEDDTIYLGSRWSDCFQESIDFLQNH